MKRNDGSIRLHPEHGLNPTIPTCFFCGEPKNEVALLGAAFKGKAPMHLCIDKQPCEKCKGWMEQGVIFCSVRDGETGDNPYRTGKWCVVKTEAVERWPEDELRVRILKTRFCFIEDKVWATLGLPIGDIDNRPKK